MRIVDVSSAAAAAERSPWRGSGLSSVVSCWRLSQPSPHEAIKSSTMFDDDNHIVETCCAAWNFFASDSDAIASITTRDCAQVSV
jgi:hypothetical protein